MPATPPPSAAADLMGFIDASPTPFHAAHNVAARLTDAGFEEFDPGAAQSPGARMVVRDGAVVAWVDGDDGRGPLRMIGAHTDSPTLRVRPRPDLEVAGMRQLRVEVYGSPLLNSWLDRDLGLAGRVVLDDGETGREVLHRSSRALLRIPQLAIHLDRGISEGLRLDRQEHMTPVWGLSDDGGASGLAEHLAAELGVDASAVTDWDLSLVDLQPSSLLGAGDELLSAPRLDNLCSVFGAVEALLALRWSGGGPAAILLYDHEEVGSGSATGAESVWAAAVLEQRAEALGIPRAEQLRDLGASMLLSADMAHATHPNHTGRHEPGHWIRAGGGPVIKHNVNARYATDAVGASEFRRACRSAGVPVQDYSHRNDLPCGSTIGPIAASRLGVRTVDVGVAQLSMHSARELMATADVAAMVAAFTSWLASGGGDDRR